MPRESDKILLRRYHEQGDLAAREQLIEQYLSLVRSLARRYSYRGEQLEDLVQIGCIGLIKAIDRFDLDRGVELTTYATPNIIGEIKRHFRDKGWAVRVPRGLQELNVQLSRIVEQLTVQLGRSPTIAELAKAAGVEEEDVLDDLQLAVTTLLERDEDEREVTIALRVGDETIEASVGPFDPGSVAELHEDAGEALGLRRLLDAVVDGVALREGPGGSWVELRKSYELAGRS